MPWKEDDEPWYSGPLPKHKLPSATGMLSYLSPLLGQYGTAWNIGLDIADWIWPDPVPGDPVNPVNMRPPNFQTPTATDIPDVNPNPTTTKTKERVDAGMPHGPHRANIHSTPAITWYGKRPVVRYKRYFCRYPPGLQRTYIKK